VHKRRYDSIARSIREERDFVTLCPVKTVRSCVELQRIREFEDRATIVRGYAATWRCAHTGACLTIPPAAKLKCVAGRFLTGMRPISLFGTDLPFADVTYVPSTLCDSNDLHDNAHSVPQYHRYIAAFPELGVLDQLSSLLSMAQPLQ
jgi:hypothetical protein